jgi:hypothetical protein
MRQLCQKWISLTAVLAFFLSCVPAGAEGLPWTPSKQEGTFLILADIHFDPFADPALVSQLAASPVDQWQSILETSKITQFSTYGKDTNYPLFKSSLEESARVDGNCDYVLVNGDYISHHFRAVFTKTLHGSEKAYQDFVLKTVVFVSRQVQQAFPNVPCYFCLGNNDSDCDDYGGLTPDTPFLSTLAKEWAVVAKDPEAVKTFLRGGYYTVARPTLSGRRFVVFNDVSWSGKYEPACHDPGTIGQDELAWLGKVFQDARRNNERITLITHMPPGMNGRNASVHEDRAKDQKTYYKQDYLWPFLNLLAPYRDLIDAEFTGHTHMDDFRVMVDRKGKPAFFTHIAPAVSPVHNNNPGFQVMLYDKESGEIKDMATYYTPLDAPGSPWKLEYDFREAYSLPAYNLDSLISLANAIENDPAVRAKFIQYMPVSCTDDPPATLANWRFYGCAHLNMDPHSYKNCYQ